MASDAMGGYGSGGHNKSREHLEGQNRINVGFLKQRGLLCSGASTRLTWTDNWGRSAGAIEVIGGDDQITLTYSARNDRDSEWRSIEEPVLVARIPKPFGGDQCYLVCPGCHQRVVELALGQTRFRCRSCHGFVHASSQQSPVNRAMRKANKLRKRLGCEPGLDAFYGRPRHMRHRTFERIDTRIRAAEAAVNDAHIQLLERLTRASSRMDAKPKRGFW